MARLMPAVIATILMVVVALVCGQRSAVRVAAGAHDVRLGLGGHYVLVSRLTRTFTTSLLLNRLQLTRHRSQTTEPPGTHV